MSKTPEDRWLNLADLLLEKIKGGALDWAETSNSEEVLTVIGDNSILLEKIHAIDDFRIVVRNSEGKEVDSFVSRRLDQLENSHPFVNYFAEFQAAYRKIQRDILGADELLDEMINDLDSLK